ncbi:MAG: glycosyltransferase family 2 protein [Actinomycetota bacterium]
MTPGYTVVIPTAGRPSLFRLLADLAVQRGGPPPHVVVVDDRPGEHSGLEVRLGRLAPRLVRSGGGGPAAARNLGWRAADTEWVAFLDDDVSVDDGWTERLAADLGACGDDVAGCQGRIRVPLPRHRPPTDAERNTARLESAAWITADMAYRRDALKRSGGFDERFPRAYREDAELALRLQRAGWRLARGERVTVHPVRDGGTWASVRAQAGNADDALMRRLHGPRWRTAAGAPAGRLPMHLVTTASAATTAVAGLLGARRAAVAAALVWAGLTAQFAWHRIRSGPATAPEVGRMVATSIAIPPAAVAHRLLGTWRCRHVSQGSRVSPVSRASQAPPGPRGRR